MAKKIIITGQNILTDVGQPWGGVNNTESAQTIYGQEIPPGAEWGVNRGEVERFMKVKMAEGENKIGVEKLVSSLDGSETRVASFRNEEDYYTWRDLPDEDKWEQTGLAYIVSYYALPSTEGIDVYNVGLTLRETPVTVQPNNNVSIDIKGTSVITYASGGTDEITETLSVKIQTRTNTSDIWTDVDSMPIPANESTYTNVSLKPYLKDGMNYIRIRAIGEYAESIWRSFSINVVNLALASRNSFEFPVYGNSLSLTYTFSGSVEKQLQFQFGTGSGTSFVPRYSGTDPGCTRVLGTETNTSVGKTFVFDNPEMITNIMSEGVHTVRARLYVNENVNTPWLENQYIVASGSTPYINVNNVNRNLDNWSEVTFFNWSAYCGGQENLRVVFRLTNENGSVEYSRWSYLAEDNNMYSLAVQLGVELSNPSISEFYAYMHIEDENGNDLAQTLFFTIANSADTQPTLGADLIILPSGRDNRDTNRNTIINAVDGSEISSTFTNFNFITDGWLAVEKDINNPQDHSTVRALRVPANRVLDIAYNPFSDFTSDNNAGKSVTFEIALRVDNIAYDTEPILKIGNQHSDGNIWGFEMLPLEAYMLTQRTRDRENQNIFWAEGITTHIVVNVVYNLNGMNLVRMMVNGNIEREFKYTTNDVFVNDNVHIVIGNTTADIDIFGIRCLKKALSVREVENDYKASLATSAEKIEFKQANDILNDDEEISWSKCIGKYNIIGHTGHLPKYGDDPVTKGKTEGVTLDIKIVGDIAHSGKLTQLTSTGQGTTAMTYYDWNQQYKINDNTVFICDDGTSSEPGAGYAVKEGEALAKKLVGKINFASGMQSHKLGLTWIFTDLYKKLIAEGHMTTPTQIANNPSARIAVYERPFLFFHRETENDPWTFKYLMTFGAGKGDKPTFGFNKNTTPNMLMVEGANNDRPLAVFRIPWNDDVVYDPDKEAWMYANQSQLNFGLGTTEKINGKEYPSSQTAINAFKNFFNFVYLHHSRPKAFVGTLSELKLSSEGHSNLVWVTEDDNIITTSHRYDLYRYSDLVNTWVNAGITKVSEGVYDVLNIRTQYETFCNDLDVTPAVWEVGQWENINNIFISARRNHFRKYAPNYIHIDDALYHSNFVKFYAGTDNRAKNTYYYTDPGTLKIRFQQDDVDTTIKTNNVGQQRKPYYVEEHDVNRVGDFYWQGENSGLYNLLEEAFDTEMETMMRNMFSAMSQLGGSVMGFHENYLFYTQDYFPVVAYNEQARVVYENAALAQQRGIYQNNSVQAITQSCGRQRWSEYQWIRDRIMYISSWCQFGEFAGNSTASGGLSWRCAPGSTYNFVLTPAKWLYPRVGSDSGNFSPGGNGRVRVAAGESINYPQIQIDNDSLISIRGIDYYFEIGDMNIGLSVDQGEFTISGKHLRKFTVNPTGADENNFHASTISVANAVNLKEFVIRNESSLTGGLDLTKCTKLEKVDLRGSTCTILDWSENTNLVELRLNGTLTSLSLISPTSLQTFSIESTRDLKTLSVVDTIRPFGYMVLSQCVAEHSELLNLTLRGENWTDPNLDVVTYVTNVPNKNVRMEIIFDEIRMTFAMKQQLILSFGNIDDENNIVHATYTLVEIEDIAITGSTYMPVVGRSYGLNVSATPIYGNNFKSVVWSLSNETYATISRDGIVTVTRAGSELEDTSATVTCTMTLMDDTVITATHLIKFYSKSLQVGDYVFSDGSYGPNISDGNGLTAVGRCFYINPNNPNDRRMVSLYTIGSVKWGITQNVTLQDGTFTADIPGITSNNNGTISTFIGSVPFGKYNTSVIITQRNRLLSDGNINLPIPEQQAEANPNNTVIDYLLQDITTYGALSTPIDTYYFPAASLCYAYEPIVNDFERQENAFYARTKWYLPIYLEIKEFKDKNIVSPGNYVWSCEESSTDRAFEYEGRSYSEQKLKTQSVYAVCQF